MFEKISLEEAVNTIIELDAKGKELRDQGAKSEEAYRKVRVELFAYIVQFSDNELYSLEKQLIKIKRL